MENTKINKAEEKRVRQAKETLTNRLNRDLIDFKERYLKSYVEYKFNELDLAIKNKKETRYEDTKGYRDEADFTACYTKAIQALENEKARVYTNTLKFINEAEEGYQIKFNRLVDSLINEGIRSYPLEIKKISGGTEFDFSFLITHTTQIKTTQVYARIIFACGEINAPHYRFIITANKNLIH